MNRLTIHLAIATCLVLGVASFARAATLTWNGGASGTWNTTGTNWTPVTTDPWDAANGGSNIASFSGAVTATVSGEIFANGIIANTYPNSITVTGGTINFAGTSPTISSAYFLNGTGNAINSKLTGSELRVTRGVVFLGGSEGNTLENLTVEAATDGHTDVRFAKVSGTAFTGNLTIDGSKTTAFYTAVELRAPGNIPSSAVVNFASGGFPNFILNGHNTTVGGISSAASGAIAAAFTLPTTGTTTLTIDNSNDYSYAGIFRNSSGDGTGTLALAKTGAGTQTLTGASSFTGGTTINGGTLRIGSNTGLGSGAVVVNANGTLTLNPGVVATNTITGTGTITVRGSGSSYGNVNTGVSGFGGTIRVDTSAFWTNITGTGSATAKWEVNGGGSTTLALYPNSSNATISLGELSGNGSLAGTATAGLTTWEVGALGTNSTYAGVIRNFTVAAPGGTAGLSKVGSGRLTLSNTNSYTGATSVNAGTLAVNGSIAASSGVSVASGATLGGSGFVSAVSGAGRVAPGNSAGILTAPSVDPTTGMGFAFEFGATGSPNYADATASVNDVFHLTGGTPLISSLTSSNAIDVYFNVATLGSGDTFRGGAYIDANVDFLTQVQGATYSYYVLGDGNGPTNGYYTLAQFDPSLSITLATVNDPAAFSGGSQDGRVMEFQAVPEPATLALFAGGLLIAGTLARRRRAA